MISIVKLELEKKPAEGLIGILLDANVFISASKGSQVCKKILDAAEKNYLSENPRFAFYTTNGVLREVAGLPEEIANYGNYITRINVENIDKRINDISNGASKTDKGLLHILANDKRVDVLVSYDGHIWNEYIPSLIRTKYQKLIQIFNPRDFVDSFLRSKVKAPVHSGLEEAEAYLQAKGRSVGG